MWVASEDEVLRLMDENEELQQHLNAALAGDEEIEEVPRDDDEMQAGVTLFFKMNTDVSEDEPAEASQRHQHAAGSRLANISHDGDGLSSVGSNREKNKSKEAKKLDFEPWPQSYAFR